MIGNNLLDWAQNEGQRNRDMVHYNGDYWYQFADFGTRGGGQTVRMFLKVFVRRTDGARLDQKRVGVVYRTPGTFASITQAGWYFTTLSDGREEWHVPVVLRASTQPVIAFTAWYQDGTGRTLYDDNQGELHAVSWTEDHAGAIQHLWGLTDAVITSEGVRGTVALRLADIAYGKDVRMHATTDGWRTVQEFGMGAVGEPNRWHWDEDFGDDFERWSIDLDLRGSFQSLEYAVLYRHGVAQGARGYDFWSNRLGQNWVIHRE